MSVLIQATPELLKRQTLPALERGVPVVVTGADLQGRNRWLVVQPGRGALGMGSVPCWLLALDLCLPNVRDRALRVIGAKVDLDTFCCPMLHVEFHLGRVFSMKLEDTYGGGAYWYSHRIKRLPAESSILPALSTIEGSDNDTTWTLALKVLWEHVQSQGEP